MNKKGSMELSVNSIVILIIAVVMMGLILGFIQTKFKSIGKDFTKNEPDAPIASASEPLTVSRPEVVVSANEDLILKVRIYNSFEAGGLFSISPEFDPNSCSPTGLQLTTTASIAGDIPYGQSVQFNTVNRVTGANPGKYICRLQTNMYAYGPQYQALSKEIVVTVE